ncbi:MAG: peptidoglycan DD-metalloendopeptidase family protein [Methylophaga sp.]|nr:peptidoglycan DD-metalloendopeptidase family protein [Methylophaga sp.]
MQIIIIPSNNRTHKHWHFTRKSFFLLVGVFTAVLVTIMMSVDTKANISLVPEAIAPTISMQTEDAGLTEQNSELAIQEYYAQRLGQLQAESIRLKALTEKIAKMAGIDTAVFELEIRPPQGGIALEGQDISQTSFQQELKQLANTFKTQDRQLEMLQNVYLTNDSIRSAIPQGSPSKEGWISSYYGKRIDPFNGKKVFHHGLDIAGKLGSKVFSVADGIITWTGKRSGYGQLVEIDHGNGYITRYAHNKTLIVKVGDRVEKGQAIALMGSTGRSTGPHVHFEVLRDGKTINPYSFVKG